MKNTLVSIVFIAAIPLHFFNQPKTIINPRLITKNVFIITTDGFRWQEVFSGADSLLMNDEQYTPDAATLNAMYWSNSAEERRKKLLPFLWNVIAAKGQIFGNRNFNNKMNVANNYSISYPGYNEMLTGIDDPEISSNSKINNPNINVLEYLAQQPEFAGKVAAFSSWDVFPYILNQDRNGMIINSGYQQKNNQTESMAGTVENGVNEKTATRYDELTFVTAKEYIKKNEPRIVYLGLGETDEFAHDGRYDLYLEQAAKVDKMIAELWHWVQTTPGYKDNTTFIITTDHGRGSKKNKWTLHGGFIKGSSQTWMAIIGPQIQALGEIKEPGQVYQQQIAQTLAHLTGQPFENEGIAPAIVLK
jgi:hypothetical protein